MRSKLVIFLLFAFVLLQIQSHAFKVQAQTTVDKSAFVSDEGGFKIAFPGKPTKKTSVIESAFGKATMTVFSFPTTLTFYGVTFIDFPNALKDETEQDIRFDTVRESLVQEFNGTLVSEKDLLFGEHRGREFTFETPAATATIRILFVEQRFFQLTVLNRGQMSKSTERVRTASQKKVDAFFNSFTITKLPTPKTVAVELPADFGLKLENSVLRIDFFGLTANLPDNWTILSKEDVDILKDLGAQKSQTGNEKANKELELSLRNTEILLMMTKETTNPELNNGVFTISAEKVSFPNFLAEAVIKNYVKESLGPTEKVSKPISSIEIGGVKFYWVETFDSADNSKTRFFIANRKGIALQFFMGYENEADLQSMLKIIQSMKFDMETVK